MAGLGVNFARFIPLKIRRWWPLYGVPIDFEISLDFWMSDCFGPIYQFLVPVEDSIVARFYKKDYLLCFVVYFITLLDPQIFFSWEHW